MVLSASFGAPIFWIPVVCAGSPRWVHGFSKLISITHVVPELKMSYVRADIGSLRETVASLASSLIFSPSRSDFRKFHRGHPQRNESTAEATVGLPIL